MPTERKLVRLIGGNPSFSAAIDFEGVRYLIANGHGELPEEAIPSGVWGYGFYRAQDDEAEIEEPSADKP